MPACAPCRATECWGVGVGKYRRPDLTLKKIKPICLILIPKFTFIIIFFVNQNIRHIVSFVYSFNRSTIWSARDVSSAQQHLSWAMQLKRPAIIQHQSINWIGNIQSHVDYEITSLFKGKFCSHRRHPTIWEVWVDVGISKRIMLQNVSQLLLKSKK